MPAGAPRYVTLLPETRSFAEPAGASRVPLETAREELPSLGLLKDPKVLRCIHNGCTFFFPLGLYH